MGLDHDHPTFQIFLVKPSKYDDDGFVVRHWRGVLPSNSLACLQALTEDVCEDGQLDGAQVEVHVVDEAVSKFPVDRITRLSRKPGQQVLVGLVAVQTNQFCRASDIALQLRKEGVPVIIGGFHVSGMMSLFPGITPEVKELMDAGVSVVAGEVENHWGEILRDAQRRQLKPIYNLLSELPDLSQAPRPAINPSYLRRFIKSNFGTIDTSRGCPFNCSFCTIINVQGRRNRHRSAECIADTLRRNYRESGVWFYFFTDDDFARNPSWPAVCDKLIELREQEDVPVEFMIQVDVASHKIPGFVEKAARAGCSNVFIGMESLNPKNLKDSGKTQNKIGEYRDLIDAWHEHKVSTHVGYIIGFPADTRESVRADIKQLMTDVQPHRASFFIMMPLPGSRDHKELVDRGVPMDADYNNYDSFHETLAHGQLKNGDWSEAYFDAWRTFYSFENMKTILAGADEKNYWDIFNNFFWYKNSALNEGAHPMLTGIFPLKSRRTRRAGFPRESLYAHLRRRVPEIYRYVRGVVRLALEMEELWLQTRKRSETERKVLEELAGLHEGLRRSMSVPELRAAYQRAKERLPAVEVPSWPGLLKQKASVLQVSRFRDTRRDLSKFWIRLRRELRRGRVHILLRADRILLNALREIRVAAGFLIALRTAPSYQAR